MKRIAVLMVGVLLAGQTGCSLFASSTQSLMVASHEDADIYVDGFKIGKGTVTHTVKRDTPHIVMAKLDGQTAAISIGNKLSTTGILDIIGGCLLFLPAFLGLLGPGAYTLDQQAITLPLEPRGTVSK